MQQERHKTKDDTWTTEELTRHLKTMQSETSNEKRPKERRPHREDNRDERRHKSERKEIRDKADPENERRAEIEKRERNRNRESKRNPDRERTERPNESDRHTDRERRDRHNESDRHAERERRERRNESDRHQDREIRERLNESDRHQDRERRERHKENDRHAERERRERHGYPDSEKPTDQEKRDRHNYPEADQKREKARERLRDMEKSRDQERPHVSGRHRIDERDQEHGTYESNMDERKMKDQEKSKHRSDDRERRHREKEKRMEEDKEHEDREMRQRKHREDLNSQDIEKERRRRDQRRSEEADGDMRHHRREKEVRGSREGRSTIDSVENSKDRPSKERPSQREDKAGRHKEKKEQKPQALDPRNVQSEEIEETIQNTDMAYEDSTNYEEDFEDYDEDFEDFSEEEKTPADIREQPPVRRDREMEEIQKAILLENENIASVTKPHDQHQEIEARELNSSARKSHRGVFIDFGSAKQRQVTSQVASKQKKRSLEILRLVDLDYSSTFSLLDLPPVKEYEMYIRNFGKTNTKQAYVQCNDDAVERDIQTEEVDTEEKWTQYPAESAVVCGGPKNDGEEKAGLATKINSQRLTNFLRSACQVMAVLLEENRAEYLSQSKVQSKEPGMSISESCFHLNTNLPFLQGRYVHLLQFSEAQRHLLMTVHCLSNQSSASIPSDLCLICVWNIWQPSAPQKILVCNSKVSCVCFSPGKASLVFAGTADGSVLVWDLREDCTLHRTIQIKDENWTFRSVTFSTDAAFTSVNHTHPVKAIEPVSGAETKDHSMSTLSSWEEISGLSFQLATLDDIGHLIFWVVVELRKTDPAGSQSDLGLIPGGKVKLIHSSSIDLSDKFFHRDILSMGIPKTLNIKFLPQDSNHFVTGTDLGIVSHGTRYGLIEAPLQYTSINKLRLSKITAIDFSPFGIPVFLAGCSDGCIRLHMITTEYPVMEWNDSTSGQSVVALQWSLTRPAMFLVLDVASCIYVWDLLQNDLQPVAKESTMPDPLQSMSVFGEPEKSSNVMGLAVAKSSGKVEIHYIKKKWAKPQPEELDKLQLILQEVV